jgi:alpha-D-xyloside xylohydrolase
MMPITTQKRIKMNTPIIEKAKALILTFFLLLLFSAADANVLSYKRESDGVRFVLDRGVMFVRLISDDIVEVKYSILPALENRKSLVVLDTIYFKTAFSVSEAGNAIVIKTRKLQIKVDRMTNAVSYMDSNGNEILSEAGDPNKVMRDTTIADIRTSSCAVSFSSPVTEALYGLGCHPLDTGSINYKGRNQNLAIKYLTGAIPVLLSTRGYGLMWDNYSESDFYGAEAGNTRFTYVAESGRMVDYYFFYGPSFDQIIDHYRDITGRAPMYPKWAFGLFQSQDRYKTQEEVLAASAGYRNAHIPVDAVVQDWYYWYPLPIGSHVMEPKAYPDPKAMVNELHKDNLHGMISIWPCFGTGTSNFAALKKANDLTNITWDNFTTHTRDTYYDAHNPKAREMYWQQARDSLIRKYDWDAWWVDQCEPDTEDPNTRKKSNFFTGRGIDYFNTYALVHTGGIYTKWRRDIAGKRIFLLARQAFAGSQRNAATLWSSDITTTFKAYKAQVPQAINACVSGIPYWTSDIGGYLSHTSPGGVPDWSLPEYRELFTRWFQFGAFCPIFRIHGKGERALFSKNWDEPTRDILLTYDRLRYRLLPYIYSLAGMVTQENYTPMRSLAFDFREDSNVYRIQDQYMFGPAFMVSPVTEPLYTGADADRKGKTRTLYLPRATWYNFWTGEQSAGGRSLAVPAPIGILPLYVKAGSIIPMGEEMEYATQKPASSIELRIYPGANGQFTLYEDENNNYDYEKGAYCLIKFRWTDGNRTLSISDAKGSFPGMLHKRIFHIVLVKTGNGVGEAPSGKFDKTVTYDGKAAAYRL